MSLTTERPGHRSLVSLSVTLFEQYLPDPFVIVIAIAVLMALLAAALAPHGSPAVILSSWYAGILGFAFRMILILVTGHALAHAAPMQRLLIRTTALASTPG